jgi:hypothetical protein
MRRSTCRSAWKVLLLLTAVSAVSCATSYNEPAESNGTAHVEAVAPVWIKSIDGKDVPRTSFTGVQRFRLSPGEHFVQVKYSGAEEQEFVTSDDRRIRRMIYITSTQDVRLTLTAEAGRTYQIKSGMAGALWEPYIAETAGPVFQEIQLD